MHPRHTSKIPERLMLVHLRAEQGLSRREAAARLGYSRSWARRWWRRYRAGGAAALQPPRAPAPGALATFPGPVGDAVLAYRRAHPRIGAGRALVALRRNPALAGAALPSARTIHRAWVGAGLVRPRGARTTPPPAQVPVPADGPHAVWQLDHQDGLRVAGLAAPVVLQSVRAPACGLTVGADLFAEPKGAHAVPTDAILDALRRRFAQWGLPAAVQVDGGVRFLGQSQRTFPSRFELFCAGLGIQVQQIRPGRPTDNGAVERLHRTLDDFLLGPTFADVAAAQAALEQHLALLNEAFPSRARPCGGQPPLAAHPLARHSGRPYDPAREAALFDLAAVDRALAGWRWYRQAAPSTGQISFANKNVRVGDAYKGQTVALRFDPTDRRVVIHELGAAPGAPGAEIRRFRCPAFEPEAIRGQPQPAADGGASGMTAQEGPPL